MKKAKKTIRLLFFSIIILIILFITLPSTQVFDSFPNIFIIKDNEKENLKALQDKYKDNHQYNSEAVLVYDLNSGNNIFLLNENKKLIPASLTKLFVIDYVLTLTNLEEVVLVDSKVLAMPKKNSSRAALIAGNYSVSHLIAGVIIPSGNDAAYALAEHCGKKLNFNSKNYQQEFLQGLKGYLQENNYKDTVINDPSGYDLETQTTAVDVLNVTKKLLKNKWLRSLFQTKEYTMPRPDKRGYILKNTNYFLFPDSIYYNPKVMGIKTGALKGINNLVSLYINDNKEYIIITIGAKTDENRYEDHQYLMEKLEN